LRHVFQPFSQTLTSTRTTQYVTEDSINVSRTVPGQMLGAVGGSAFLVYLAGLRAV